MQTKDKNLLKKILQKTLKIFLWFLGILVGLFLLVLLLIQIPQVQNFAKNKAVNYLEGKIKTRVTIGNLKIDFPKNVVLQDVYFADQQNDTLLAGKELSVNISLFKLLDNKIELNSVSLTGINATISKNNQSVYNFEYIVKALTSPPKPNDTSTPMEFSIDKINLDNVNFKFKDAVTNTNVLVALTHFDTRIKTFDLNKMEFEVPNANINGLKLKVKQHVGKKIVGLKKPAKSSKSNFNLKLGKVNLSKIAVVYEDELSRLFTNINLEKLNVKFNAIDLKKELIDIETFDLNDAKGNLEFRKLQKIINKNYLATSSKSINWKVKINKVNLKKVDFKFDDFNSKYASKGIDYNHLDVQDFNLKAKKINYSQQNTSGKVNELSILEKSGLQIKALKTDFNYNDNGVSLLNLVVITPQSSITDEVIVGYPSVASIRENLGEITIKAVLKNSKIGIKDLLLFAPTLATVSPFNTNPNAILSVNTIVSGKLKNLSFPNMQVSGIGNTKINASGRIVGLPDAYNAYYDLNIKNLESTSKDVAQFVPKGTIPKNIQLPSKFNTQGTFKGTMKNFQTNLKLASSFGNGKIKATYDQRRKNYEKYDAQAELQNFDLGKFIKNDSIGKVSLKANAKGIGLNPKTANATVNGTILKADFNDYVYTNLKVNGKINNGMFTANANANDPNLTFNMISNGSFKGKYPSGKLKLNIDIADLRKLNLHAGALKLKGDIDADIQTANLDFLNGQVSATNFIIANEKEQYVLDSITINATATREKNTMILKSQFINAEIDGKYELTKIANSIQNSFANYYNTNPGSRKFMIKNQQFAFKVNVKESPLFVKFIPELKSISPIALSGRYNSANDTIVLNGAIPKLVYGANTISGAIISIDTKDKALVYNLIVDDIQNSNFQFPYTNLSGKIKDNTIDYSLQLKDLKDKERYLLVGTLKSLNGNSDVNLNPTNLILNYEKWNLSEENLIRMGKNGLFITDFDLNKDGNSIRLQSQSAGANAPLEINFKDFEIETFTNIAQKSDLQIGGKVNGNAVLTDLMKSVKFTSNATIDNFSFQKDTVGNLKINVDNQVKDTYNAAIEITGFDNQAKLNGIYKTSDSSFDFALDIQKLNVKSLQGFSFGNISESTGFLNGNLKIVGNTTKPKVFGDLKFNEVGFKVKLLNAKFQSMNDAVAFTDNLIALNNFVIKDEKNNELALNGTIISQDITNIGFNLKIDGDNFKAMNSKAKDNELFYGELYLDNHITLKGTMESPIVEGDVRINKDTKFTIVIPQSDPSIADREGIVEFIDQDQPSIITKVALDSELSQSEIKGILASVNIEIDKDAEISIIIDKTSGDFLKLKGEAQLTGGIDPSGKTSLTGRYEFTDGSYEMNFNLIKRKFNIKNGSYILWTGEPTTADMNITAIYKSRTAPIDLVNDQLGEITNEERNTYKERIQFETELKLTGELLKPIINFDIVLPEGNNNVSTEVINTTQAKLTQLREQPDELNKQVFALLLLNRFIGENPFSTEGSGVTASGFARDSASKLLSQQLNNFTEDLISGVELNFDIESNQDYSSGQKQNKTDLNVGISKKLLNDRLKVTVGSNFGLEGTPQANQEANTIAGDVSLDYQLTKDGRYKVRAYRLNKYQVALQGQVVETGIAFTLTIDYNKFKELFAKSKVQKSQSKKKKEKENKKKSNE